MVRSEAVQRIGDRNVVFSPKEVEPGSFIVRDVELGGVADGYQRVISGLKFGERVVTKGSFTLKTQMLKGSMADEE
jgi:cobalt-zinc-cadmium efflux system membrane fusion protein